VRNVPAAGRCYVELLGTKINQSLTFGLMP